MVMPSTTAPVLVLLRHRGFFGGVMKDNRNARLRPIYGIALAIILVLGFIGGAVKIVHDNGRAPNDNPMASKQGYRWQ